MLIFKKHRAFTILELIIVVIIIGVLASLALPRLAMMIEGARATEVLTAFSAIRASLERYYLMNGEYPLGFFLNYANPN